VGHEGNIFPIDNLDSIDSSKQLLYGYILSPPTSSNAPSLVHTYRLRCPIPNVIMVNIIVQEQMIIMYHENVTTEYPVIFKGDKFYPKYDNLVLGYNKEYVVNKLSELLISNINISIIEASSIKFKWYVECLIQMDKELAKDYITKNPELII